MKRRNAREISRRERGGALLALVAITLGLCLSFPAHARDRVQAEREFETTFQQMMADPGNVDTTMHYANLAIELENYEAAIPALERILFFNPGLHEVRLELGVLYYNLHSYDVAREYFTGAKEDGAPAEVADKANDYLAKMEKPDKAGE